MESKVTDPVSHAKWTQMLSRVEHAVINSIHSSTQQSSTVLLVGVQQRDLDIDNLTEYLEYRTVP